MSFQEHITIDNIAFYAATNLDTCESPKGLVTQFHGLYDSCFGLQDPDFAKRCDKHNMLYLYPYGGQWNWMNTALVRTTDRCIDILFEKFGLDEKTPVISTGHSMGGYGALMFTLNSVHNVIACAANCPVCDLYAFSSSEEVIPRTIVHAFGGYDGSYDAIMKNCSPVYRVKDMPDIPYYIVHGMEDATVDKKHNSDVFVSEMKKFGKNVLYDEVRDMGHVAMPGVNLEKYFEFIFKHI